LKTNRFYVGFPVGRFLITCIAKKYLNQVEDDKVIYEKNLAELQVTLKEKHAENLVEKQRLSKMQSVRHAFEESIIQKQKVDYDKMIEETKGMFDRIQAMQVKIEERILEFKKMIEDENYR
jgi:hypothetical protein